MDPAACPYVVSRAVMVHHWNTLTFLHWRFDPEAVQRLLPPGLTIETMDGAAWVGLVPFFMRVGLPGVGSAPWASRFCETNVRTYVRDPSGRSGIWFFSLDAARLGAVLVARSTYGLPYYWSRMRVVQQGDRVRYECRRRWPGGQPLSRAVIDIGPAYRADELGALDHFLTARWLLFSVTARRRRYAIAQHDPWPLHRATASECDGQLLAAAGLDVPIGDPVVHYSPGVQVRIGRPERAGRSPS